MNLFDYGCAHQTSQHLRLQRCGGGQRCGTGGNSGSFAALSTPTISKKRKERKKKEEMAIFILVVMWMFAQNIDNYTPYNANGASRMAVTEHRLHGGVAATVQPVILTTQATDNSALTFQSRSSNFQTATGATRAACQRVGVQNRSGRIDRLARTGSCPPCCCCHLFGCMARSRSRRCYSRRC